MKILLVNACGLRLEDRPWQETGRKHAYAPTTLTTLAALVPPELGADVRIVDEAVDKVPDDLGGADLVGISAMTCDAPRAYELADRARQKGITVVMGGYHVTFMADEALSHADAVVVGFAEEAWPALLRDFARGTLQRRYEGPWAESFARSLPVPRRDLLNGARYIIPATLESSRGCPNGCRFCVIPAMHRRAYVSRDLTSLTADLDSIGRRRFAFLDSNPFEDPTHGGTLFARLTEQRCTWFAAASLDCIRGEEWVKRAARSGCRGLLIGFESLNHESLAGDGKGQNRVDEYKRVVSMLHDHGIAVLGCFVFGFDSDDNTVFERTVEFVDRAGIDLVLYSIYTPLPGSPALARLESEGRIVDRDWRRYDGRHAVFTPVRMSIDQLQEGLLQAWTRTYRLTSIVKRAVAASPSPFFSLVGNIAFRYYRRTFLPQPERQPVGEAVR
jgi:radical SAM superfamily enzyme YgiQ (UPF0313 family)